MKGDRNYFICQVDACFRERKRKNGFCEQHYEDNKKSKRRQWNEKQRIARQAQKEQANHHHKTLAADRDRYLSAWEVNEIAKILPDSYSSIVSSNGHRIINNVICNSDCDIIANMVYSIIGDYYNYKNASNSN